MPNTAELKQKQGILDQVTAKGEDLVGLQDGYKVVHTATILREGWEMDNRLWVVEGRAGRIAVTTNHGGLCLLSDAELDGEIASHQRALQGLAVARHLLQPDGA